MTCAAYVRGPVRGTVRPLCGEVCGELCGIAVRPSVRGAVRYRSNGLRWKSRAYAVDGQNSPTKFPRNQRLRVPCTVFPMFPCAVIPVKNRVLPCLFSFLHCDFSLTRINHFKKREKSSS